jgi:hypothetical protein
VAVQVNLLLQEYISHSHNNPSLHVAISLLTHPAEAPVVTAVVHMAAVVVAEAVVAVPVEDPGTKHTFTTRSLIF